MKYCVDCGARSEAPDWVCPACGWAPRMSDGAPILSDPADRAAGDAEYLVSDLAAAEPWHFWFQSRRRLILATLGRYAGGLASVLDVGCGTGFMLEALHHWRPELQLSGCEVHPASLDLARARLPRAFVFPAVNENLPFREEFDAVLALDVIEHIDDDEAAC